mmetsp:Transcript_13759/g.29363  ORF Transcript_13759/g.29363 Transcript_13759/m.29363 type:complete len:232 (+) Transcript_13759:593-1288(+)
MTTLNSLHMDGSLGLLLLLVGDAVTSGPRGRALSLPVIGESICLEGGIVGTEHLELGNEGERFQRRAVENFLKFGDEAGNVNHALLTVIVGDGWSPLLIYACRHLVDIGVHGLVFIVTAANVFIDGFIILLDGCLRHHALGDGVFLGIEFNPAAISGNTKVIKEQTLGTAFVECLGHLAEKWVDVGRRIKLAHVDIGKVGLKSIGSTSLLLPSASLIGVAVDVGTIETVFR